MALAGDRQQRGRQGGQRSRRHNQAAATLSRRGSCPHSVGLSGIAARGTRPITHPTSLYKQFVCESTTHTTQHTVLHVLQDQGRFKFEMHVRPSMRFCYLPPIHLRVSRDFNFIKVFGQKQNRVLLFMIATAPLPYLHWSQVSPSCLISCRRSKHRRHPALYKYPRTASSRHSAPRCLQCGNTLQSILHLQVSCQNMFYFVRKYLKNGVALF